MLAYNVVLHQYNILGCICMNAHRALLSDRDIATATRLGLCDVGTGLELLESLGYIKLRYWSEDGKEKIGYEATQGGWTYWREEQVFF